MLTHLIARHVNIHTARYACEHVTVIGCAGDLLSSIVHSSGLESASKLAMFVGCGAIYLAHFEESTSPHALAHKHMMAMRGKTGHAHSHFAMWRG